MWLAWREAYIWKGTHYPYALYVDNCCHWPKWWKCHNIVDRTDCEPCSFNYKTDTNMKSHMIHKHYFKLFHICEGTFSGLEELKKHLARETLRRWFSRDLNWGVSYHHKASPDPIFFWKHQVCAEGSQHPHETNTINNFYTKKLLYFCGFLDFFDVWKICFWIFIRKNCIK